MKYWSEFTYFERANGLVAGRLMMENNDVK